MVWHREQSLQGHPVKSSKTRGLYRVKLKRDKEERTFCDIEMVNR